MSDNQANMPLPSSMATDLAELKDIEKVITSQLTELGQKIDSSFSKAAEFVNNVTEVASSFAKSSKTRNTIQFIGTAASATVKGIGDAYSAYKYNKALDALLKQKQEIAEVKISAIEKLQPKLEHMTDNYSKLLNNFTSKEYDLEKIQQSSYSEPLYNNIDKLLAMLRAILYNKTMAEYIHAEYTAWLNGEHQSKLSQPTYWNINEKLMDYLKKPNMLELIDKYSTITTGNISGNEVCFLHDQQLMSFAMSLNSNKLFNCSASGKCLGKPSTSFDTDMFIIQDNNPVLLPSSDFFETYRDAVSEYNSIYESMNWKISIVKFFGLIFVFGLIGSIVALFDGEIGLGLLGICFNGVLSYLFYVKIIESIEENNKVKLETIAKNSKKEYKTAAGYVAIRKKSLKKKDVLNSFLSNFS